LGSRTFYSMFPVASWERTAALILSLTHPREKSTSGFVDASIHRFVLARAYPKERFWKVRSFAQKGVVSRHDVAPIKAVDTFREETEAKCSAKCAAPTGSSSNYILIIPPSTHQHRNNKTKNGKTSKREVIIEIYLVLYKYIGYWPGPVVRSLP
jgi:hypothetical protein